MFSLFIIINKKSYYFYYFALILLVFLGLFGFEFWGLLVLLYGMDLMVKYFFLVLQVCAIASSVVLHGSSGHKMSPSASFSAVPPIIEGSPHRVTQEEQITRNSPSPTSQPNASPHFESASGPQANKGLEPSLSPNTPLSKPPPSKDPGLPADAPAPIKSIPEGSPPSAPVIQPTTPETMPPIPQQDKGHDLTSPGHPPIISEPVASPPSKLPITSPPTYPTLPVPPPNLPVPVELPPSTLPRSPLTPPTLLVPPPNLPAPVASPPSTLPRTSLPSPPTLTVPLPNLPAPVAFPPSTLPRTSPPSPPPLTVPPPNLPAPVASPPSTLPRKSPPSPPPLILPPPNLPVPVASRPPASPRNLPPPHPTLVEPPPNLPAPVASPPRTLPKDLQPIHHNSSMPPPNLREPHVSPISTPLPSTKGRDRFPVSSPPNQTTNVAPTHHSPVKAPIVRTAPSSYNHAPSPDSSYESPPTKSHPPPSLPPLYPPPPPGPKSRPRHNALPPPPGPESNPSHHAPPPPNPGSAVPPIDNSVSPAISPSTTSPSIQTTMPVLSPKISPRSSRGIPKPIQALPPPPPNEDCLSITCKEPLTNTPPGTPCNCVMPMQLKLGLSVALYTFFPLVSELAFEIAAGVFMRSSQVRIMGANADNQDPEKTIVLIDLVPLGEKFDNFTAYVTAQRLWLKQVAIKPSLFGDYEVLYVKYPGLPPSPPLPSSSNGLNGEPYGHGNNGRNIKPLGVDVSKQRHSDKLNGSMMAIIALSAVVAVVLVSVAVWVLLFKRRDRSQLEPTPPATLPSLTKSSGIGASMVGSGPTSASLSFRSSIAYTGSAKTFSSSDIEKATDNFNESGVLGEGGFGRVYSGVLEDGTKVAVKVLKRDDQQGGREFLAEVEMLSRLHHRNLVRLLGICTEERNRCLVYELIPNGSVESHLHGIDKETAPLDWGARLKIALGAARGLAYLHEDSSPRVIHRDFKSSNILLEHDFTPKVSDFGLARTALDEENRHISTRVMGTFGYVAPEYAMTGHLLVKSDVYSYGVVLLELLTGRKPVDMLMPPGQENLVAWARPLLPTPGGLNLLIDPSLCPEVPFDSIAKVAAIASMCVQPEVSHRPFMGEVVQALKLVCNECEETRDLGSRSCSQEDLTSIDFDARISTNSGTAQSTNSNNELPLDMESGFLASGLGLDVGSYRVSSSSGPLRTGRRVQLWERMKRFSSGSVGGHGDFFRLLSRSH